MRSSLFQVSVRASLVVAALSLSCGGSAPPVTNTPSLPTATAATPPPPAVDLSPVPMPKAVVLTLHAAHMSQTADIVGDWAGTPLDVHEPLAEMVGERIAKIVGDDGPGDMAVILEDRGEREPEFRFVASLPVRNADAARSSLQSDYGLLPLGNGAFEIQRAGGRHEGDADFRVCAFAPSIDGARIVCSRTAALRDAALPYMTRGMPLQKSSSDLHVEASSAAVRPIIERFRNRLQTQGARELGGGRDLRPAFENAVGDMLDGILDADVATLDATIDKAHGTAELSVKGKSSHALITKMLTSHPEKAEAVPAAFLALPADADVAFFAHGFDSDQITSPRDQVVRALDAALSHEQGMSPADRKAMTDAFSHSADLLASPFVYARGVDVSKAMGAMVPANGDAAKIRAAEEQAAGWDVLGTEAAPEKVTGALKDWVAAFGRPGFVKWTKERSSSNVPPSWRVAATPGGLPKGAAHFTLTVTHDDSPYYGMMGLVTPSAQGTNAKPRKKPPIALTLHIVVVPGQGRTWVASSLDQATAVAKAKFVSGSATTGTLASRSGLEALKSARLNAGGFTTMRGVGMGMPLTWLWDSPRDRVGNDPLLGTSTQSQASTPLVLGFTETNDGGPGFTMSFHMPRAALADVMQVGPRIFR